MPSVFPRARGPKPTPHTGGIRTALAWSTSGRYGNTGVSHGAPSLARALLNRLVSRGRADDTEEFICNRMKVYRDETAPLGITATI